ncbi:hypothetical protein EVAR_77351_1 [Eumeta japonica]|uniref:Uncharacterized protein n=1 Tax=Eumeta variegata TaxID=151549 RepID=A0A4C1UYF9_EUMVA|nr:hypothetical protein EVAR_77351_1 [Eumeta japonica]
MIRRTNKQTDRLVKSSLCPSPAIFMLSLISSFYILPLCKSTGGPHSTGGHHMTGGGPGAPRAEPTSPRGSSCRRPDSAPVTQRG